MRRRRLSIITLIVIGRLGIVVVWRVVALIVIDLIVLIIIALFSSYLNEIPLTIRIHSIYRVVEGERLERDREERKVSEMEEEEEKSHAG